MSLGCFVAKFAPRNDSNKIYWNLSAPSVSYPMKVNPTLEVEHESGIKEGNKAC